jgi:hypothetical protein
MPVKITPRTISAAISTIERNIKENDDRIRKIKKGTKPLRQLPRNSWVGWGEGETEIDVRVIERIQDKNKILRSKLDRLQKRLAIVQRVSNSKAGRAIRAVGTGTRRLFSGRRQR